MCHKPCTVSGGGKSEISKSISDAIIHGPVFTADFKKDCDQVEALLSRDYSDRFKDPAKAGTDQRPILSPERSLGSVVKLFTPSERDYSEEFNQWLHSIPQYILELVFVVKRFYKPSWNGNWREHFSVDIINGTPGNELKCDKRKLISNFLRVGYEADGSWRVFRLAQGFFPRRQGANGGRHHRLGRRAGGRLKNLNPDYSNPSRQICPQLRSPPLPAARRGDSSRLRQTDREGFVRAGQFPLQFRAADRGPTRAIWWRIPSALSNIPNRCAG